MKPWYTKESAPLKRCRRVIPATVRPIGLGILALMNLAVYATRGATGLAAVGIAVPALTTLAPGVIALTSPMTQPSFSFDAPQGRIQSAGEGAREATRAVLNTPELPMSLDRTEGGWEIHEAVGVLEFGAAPFVAAYGALRGGHRRLSPDQLSETESDLVQAMRSMARQRYLRELVAEAATNQDRWPVIPLASVAAGATARGPVSGVLETRVEELRLQRLGKSDSSFVLRIKARGRLSRASDGAVLCDRPYEYQSDRAMFIDWARLGGLKSVAETGYRTLAEQIAGELVPSAAQAPLLLGVGYRTRPPQWPQMNLVPAVNLSPFISASVQPASLSTTDSGGIEIYPKRSGRNLFIQQPLTRQEAVDEAVADNGWVLDGLQDDRNSVVQVVACAAAIPRGIWKQAVGLVRGIPQRRLEAQEASIGSAALRAKPTTVLAREVALRLAPQTSEPVLLAAEPPSATPGTDSSELVLRRAGQAPPGLPTALMATLRPPASPAGVSLEIQVLDAELSGKPGINPPLALCLKAKASLYYTRNRQELYSCQVHYRSQERRFKAWAAADALLFRHELEHGYAEISDAIARQLVSKNLVAPVAPPNSTIAKN